MFENDIFDTWLDTKSKELVHKIGNQETLSSEEMIILVLKAQSNHFHHLDQDLRKDMKDLREDFQKENAKLREDFQKENAKLREDFQNDMKALRIDMDRRFEQVERRFEQVDKRFEQVDKRFDSVIARMDRFMVWSLGLTMSSTIFIIGFMFNFMK